MLDRMKMVNFQGIAMLIWRGLQPALMAQLIVGLAEARKATRKPAASTPVPKPTAPQGK